MLVPMAKSVPLVLLAPWALPVTRVRRVLQAPLAHKVPWAMPVRTELPVQMAPQARMELLVRQGPKVLEVMLDLLDLLAPLARMVPLAQLVPSGPQAQTAL